jgi:hypothetical protein
VRIHSKFSRSSILLRWARKRKSLDALLPILYLRGLSAGDFKEALTILCESARSPNADRRRKVMTTVGRVDRRRLFMNVRRDGAGLDRVQRDGRS